MPQGVYERVEERGLWEISWIGAPGRVDVPGALGWREIDWPPRPLWIVGARVAVRDADGPPAPPGLLDIAIRGDGFGTGAHPTTRACLEALLRLEPRGSFADLGCGSGVVAIVAARLGFAPVTAVDVDAAAVAAAAANAGRNGADVQVGSLDLASEPPPQAATVAANVPLEVHRAIAARVGETAGTVIVSGISAAAVGEVRELYGLPEATRSIDAGWATIVLKR